jgi:hypothetical protein
MRTKEGFYTSSPRKPTYETYNISTSNGSPACIDKIDHTTDFKANGANLFSMSNKLDNTNPKKNYESRNIFTILRKNECDILKTIKSNNTGALPNTIKIYIKNENKISNYFTKEDFKEPVIMSHSKYTSTFKEKSPTRPASPSRFTPTDKHNASHSPRRTFSEKYTRSTGDSKSTGATRIITTSQPQPQPPPRASSPRPATESSPLRSYTPAMNTSPSRKDTFHELKSKYNLTKLPSYTQPQATANKLPNVSNSNNNLSPSKTVLHRRKLAKDSSDEYTSFNTFVDEMTHITSDDGHTEENLLNTARNASPTRMTSSPRRPMIINSNNGSSSKSRPSSSNQKHLDTTRTSVVSTSSKSKHERNTTAAHVLTHAHSIGHTGGGSQGKLAQLRNLYNGPMTTTSSVSAPRRPSISLDALPARRPKLMPRLVLNTGSSSRTSQTDCTDSPPSPPPVATHTSHSPPMHIKQQPIVSEPPSSHHYQHRGNTPRPSSSRLHIEKLNANMFTAANTNIDVVSTSGAKNRHEPTETPPEQVYRVGSGKSNRGGLPKLQASLLQNQTSSSSTNNNVASDIGNKKLQDSSNFSMIRAMNSNELGNYIDNVILNFRMKTSLYESIVENKELKTNVFYPENEDYRYQGQVEDTSTEKQRVISEKPPPAVNLTRRAMSPIVQPPQPSPNDPNTKPTKSNNGSANSNKSNDKSGGKDNSKNSSKNSSNSGSMSNQQVQQQVPAPLPPASNLHRSKPVDANSLKRNFQIFNNLLKNRPTNTDGERVIAETTEEDNEEGANEMVESRTLSDNEPPNRPFGADEEDSATFINFTHSIEIDDSDMDFDDVEIGAGLGNILTTSDGDNDEDEDDEADDLTDVIVSEDVDDGDDEEQYERGEAVLRDQAEDDAYREKYRHHSN